MTPRERELILKVADDVRAADRSEIDPEAERLIRTEVAAQRNAAYLLTQRVIVQELALRRAQEKLDELEDRLRRAGLPVGPGRGSEGGMPAAAGDGMGNFLRTAAATAAGVIGAQLIYDGVRHLLAADAGPGPDVGGWHPDDAAGDHTGAGADLPPSTPPTDPSGEWGGGGDFADDFSVDPIPVDTDIGGGGDFDSGSREAAADETGGDFEEGDFDEEGDDW
jgi:hypothetical protein